MYAIYTSCMSPREMVSFVYPKNKTQYFPRENALSVLLYSNVEYTGKNRQYIHGIIHLYERFFIQ